MIGKKNRVEALTLRLRGLTYAEIGARLGVSRQYAQQLVRPVSTIYNAVKQRAKGKCEQCGIEIRNGHVHHKLDAESNPKDFNNLDNLAYLCIGCHQVRHRYGEPKPR